MVAINIWFEVLSITENATELEGGVPKRFADSIQLATADVNDNVSIHC